MLFPPIPTNELERVAALHELNILDSPQDVRFDNITKFAATNLSTPFSFISFLDLERQWYKSKYGADVKQIYREFSICAHAISEIQSIAPRARIQTRRDLLDDSRFFDNPFVKGEPWYRSHMCFVLQSIEGMSIGTISVVDTRPRRFKLDEISLLIELGLIVEDMIHGNQQSINYQLSH